MENDDIEALTDTNTPFFMQVRATVSAVISCGEQRKPAVNRIRFRRSFDFICSNLSSFEFRRMFRMDLETIYMLTASFRDKHSKISQQVSAQAQVQYR